MDLIRATATFAHRSGLPKDQVSNTFWFSVPGGADEAAATAIANRVQAFYMTPVAPRGVPLSVAFSGVIADAGHTIKTYDYDMATGARLSFEDGPPITTTAFDFSGLASRENSEHMPSEVAMCLSYRSLSGAVPGGGNFATPLAQRRGRIYIGPLTVQSSVEDAAGTVPRPSTSYIIDLANAAAFSLQASNNATADWVVYSRPYAGRAAITAAARKAAGGPERALPALPARSGQAYVIDQMWCDDSWDTQRRRGEAPTTRIFA